ncbi:MAG: OmpH family outer membrane protein [Flavobacteriales bacterium]|jgi:outer membrane protein|nr:OmpH family outer membrane protein [Flavobacteriales bacterium]|tara:strand:+ start:438 stop:935 length:498 start_codon:yes stop_codon:yes gene_type:complete
MKKITFLFLISLITLSAFSQNKFGYIDSQELLMLMPERKTAESEVQSFAKSLESQLAAMTAEYQESVQDYQSNEASYTDLIKQDKIAEITGLEQRIQAFQQNAQQSLQKKEQELLEPILSKARSAIEEVAIEGNFTYIFDKSVGSILYAKESENVLSLVKKKLKL